MSRNQNGRTAEQRKFRPQLEALEDRCCPSVTVQQHGDTLEIQGDNANNVVAVVATFGIVTVNANGGQLNSFFGIENIEINLGSGNDAVIFETGGVQASPLDPNPFVQAAQMQNRGFIDMLRANPSLLQNPFIQKLVRFGDTLDVNVDGGDGINAFFANAPTFFNASPFATTRVDLNLDDVDFAVPTSLINTQAAIALYGFRPPNFVAPGTTLF